MRNMKTKEQIIDQFNKWKANGDDSWDDFSDGFIEEMDLGGDMVLKRVDLEIGPHGYDKDTSILVFSVNNETQLYMLEGFYDSCDGETWSDFNTIRPVTKRSISIDVYNKEDYDEAN